VASIVTYGRKRNLRRIEFSHTPNGVRQRVWLGKVNRRVAETWKAKIEALVCDKAISRPHDPEVTAWLTGLDKTSLAKLRKVGLADGVGLEQTTMGAFLERYFAAITSKPATRTFYGHVRRNLETHFGTGKLVRDVTAENADGFRAWLVEHEKLSGATVARRVKAARTLWRKAIRWKLAAENPFVGVKTGHQSNDARKVFVPPELINRVIAEAPDAEWRAIIALARYGGLRCPSEIFALRWRDIDWDRAEIRVTVQKLAHIEHCAFRIVPLFPELRGPLMDLFDTAPDGAEYVISEERRLGSGNLGQEFSRIIERSGASPWPRLFQNLRASRETELMREHDLATVCKWIGNTPAVAATHYAMSVNLDADFRKAAGLDRAQQKAQQSAVASESRGLTGEQAEPAKPLENKGNVNASHIGAIQDKDIDWAQQDSNLRPTDYESAALTN